MSIKYLVTVIVVTFNSEKYIRKCLNSIIKNFPSDSTKRIIVIDNNSRDNTVNIALSFSNKLVEVITLKKNIGFAKAVNIGIKKQQKSKYYLLLNPDTEILKGSINTLIQTAESNDAGICGGKTVGFKGEHQGDHFREPNIYVGLFDFSNLRKLDKSDYWHKYFYYEDRRISDKPYQVDVVTGGFMLISRTTIKKNGLFDERFFMYLEDVDYCTRAKKQGIKILYCPGAIIRHYGGGSSANKERSNSDAWIDSRKKYFLKHYGVIANLVIQPIFLLDSIMIRSLNIMKS